MKPNVGLPDGKTKQVASSLGHVLADTYVLYVKTQNFHWNLVDPRFIALHKMFEEQYEQLAEATDVLAERIRGLGYLSPASLGEFLKLTSLKEAKSDLSGDEMLRTLLHDHETIIRTIRPLIAEFTEIHDEGSADVLIDRIREHEKTAWFIRSHLTKG